ncbi:MAG: hypothetical protein Tsb002_19310 [Wenzhouxiangellaceae bacterium]
MPRRRDWQQLSRACTALGYTLRQLDSGLWQIEDGARCLPLPPGYWPMNTHAACAIAIDKRHSHALLRDHGVDTPQQLEILLDERLDERLGDVRQQIDDWGFPVFVKPDKGSLGQLAARVAHHEQLAQHLRLTAQRYHCALIQRYIEQPEYRLFYLRGEMLFHYRRHPPSIIGDGQRSLSQAVDDLCRQSPAFDPDYGLDKNWILEQLLRHKLTWNSVVPAGLTIRLGACSNLISGGQFSDFSQQPLPACEQWLNRIARLFRLELFAVDLFSASQLRDPTDFCVIDINSNPQLESLDYFNQDHLRQQIWQKILQLAMSRGG